MNEDVIFPSYCMSIDCKGQLGATHWKWTCGDYGHGHGNVGMCAYGVSVEYWYRK